MALLFPGKYHNLLPGVRFMLATVCSVKKKPCSDGLGSTKLTNIVVNTKLDSETSDEQSSKLILLKEFNVPFSLSTGQPHIFIYF